MRRLNLISQPDDHASVSLLASAPPWRLNQGINCSLFYSKKNFQSAYTSPLSLFSPIIYNFEKSRNYYPYQQLKPLDDLLASELRR